MKDIRVDGASFDLGWLAGLDNVEAFLSEMEKPGQAHVFEGQNREEKLRTVFKLSRPAPEVSAQSAGENRTTSRKRKIVD